MDREIVLLVLSLLLAGPLLLVAGRRSRCMNRVQSGREFEDTCWRAVWNPLRPAALGLSALVGWALVEPEEAEPLPLILMMLAVPFAVVWGRAGVRALEALRKADRISTAAVVGLLRPRMLIARPFLRRLDSAARCAVKAHERAHMRHHDPLRLWLAQLATDLQWPSRGAQARFDEWRHALEVARDEEARYEGIDGADLAAAILNAVRVEDLTTARSCLTLTGDAAFLDDRVRRLLAPLPSGPSSISTNSGSIVRPVLCLVAALTVGASFGEIVVRTFVAALS